MGSKLHCRLLLAFFVSLLLWFTGFARADNPPTAPPATRAAEAIPIEEQGFDPAEHLFGEVFGLRERLFQHGISIDPYLIVDYSKNFLGGLDTHGDSFRQRFNLPVEINTDKFFGLHGGTIFAVYQLQHGGNASHTLTGDAQNFSFGTDADGRSQLGQLWYQQKFFNDTLRLRLGKMDGNADFDVLDNAQEFLNNSFSTSPTLGLMPSFPDNGTGIQLFYEPANGMYAGAAVFDGSGARGVRTGEIGPKHFFDRSDDLFFISEIGARYKAHIGDRHFPGKVSLGGWWDTNHFDRLDSAGRQTGTGGVYLTLDQVLWKPFRQLPIPAGPPGASPTERPEQEEYPGGVAASFSVSWADPTVNRIDANALLGLSWTGAITNRPIDVLGAGATWAHFSSDAGTRDPYELALETFYRIRFTQWVSLKPDLQYIIHPNGSEDVGQTVRNNALVMTLRLEVAF